MIDPVQSTYMLISSVPHLDGPLAEGSKPLRPRQGKALYFAVFRLPCTAFRCPFAVFRSPHTESAWLWQGRDADQAGAEMVDPVRRLLLPLHCPCTALALPFHCLSTAFPLPFHCLSLAPGTAFPLPLHCHSLPLHCLSIARALPFTALALTFMGLALPFLDRSMTFH